MRGELAQKDTRLKAWCAATGHDGIHLRTRANVAWITGGSDVCVDRASPLGVASVLWTPHEKVVLTDTIEARRLLDEEVPSGFSISAHDWFSSSTPIADGIATDFPNDPITALRAPLTREEITRYRKLGFLVSTVVESVLKDVRVGDSELEVAGRLAGVLATRGVSCPVTLAAADGRIAAYRHPIPTNLRIEKALMLIVCAERQGLIVAMTRLIHFGAIASDLRARHHACCTVDTALHNATQYGTPLADIFSLAQRTYAEMGFDGEWCFHHQGGPIGYRPRDAIVVPQGPGLVLKGQAYAWNPSITGTKSEDTILAGGEVLTPCIDWPLEESGRPDWLVRPATRRR